MQSPSYYFNIYLKIPVKKFFRNLDWQAASVVVAMLLFVAQISFTVFDKWRDSTDDEYKLRVILFSEISNNFLALATGGDDSRVLGTQEICIPLPEDNTLALKRIAVMTSYLQEDVYKSQLSKLSILPKDEVNSIVKSYYSISRFKNLSSQLQNASTYSPAKLNLLKEEYYNLYAIVGSLFTRLEKETANP
jgi:hypothetical protein